jgi:hypothetical protein
MAPTQDDLKRAADEILVLLHDSEISYPPTQLLRRLEDRGISEYSARVAIWYLIDRNLIELTLNRMLRSAHSAPGSQLAGSSALAGD